MAMTRFEDRELKVDRKAIEVARHQASIFRANAEEDYRRAMALASKWELFASLLEQGLEEDEARRRAFRPRIEQ